MAYHGRDATVHELFTKIPLRDRDACQSVCVLNSVLRGGIALIKESRRVWQPAAAAVQDDAFTAVGASLNQFIGYCAGRGIAPRELFERILDWSAELSKRSRTDEMFRLLERAEELNIRRYPDLYARLVLGRAMALFDTGRHQEAHQVISALAERYYLIPDWNLISRILFFLSQTSLRTGEAGHFKTLLFGGLRHFYTHTDTRRLFTGLLGKTYRRPYKVLLDRRQTLSDKVLFLAHWLDHTIHNSRPGRKFRLDRVTRFGVLSLVYYLNYVRWQYRSPRTAALAEVCRRSAGSDRPKKIPSDNARKAILVTRVMGGIGDFLTMTPGFHALKAMHPDHEIDLAVPRQYHSLFTGNPDVTVLDIENASIVIGSYAKWFNLTDCPASRIESRTAPNVKMSRIDIFAQALGIRGRRLRTMDRLPRYFMTDEEILFQQDFWKEYRLAGKSVIGVQLQAAESYKDFPHMAALVRKLATEFAVILFQVRKTTIQPGDNVIDPGSLTIREAFALAAACDGVVAPDSAFVHFAGAVGIPCIALEGPVGGLGTRYYPSCTCVDARSVLKCIPCWRNEFTPCKLTNMRTSACMEHITVDEVYGALKKTLREHKRCRVTALSHAPASMA
jgi:ADP-heptose:LPS heptosyltransferase